MIKNDSRKEEPVTISVNELSDFLNISRKSAYKLCHKEGFPSIRINEKRILIVRDKLLSWLDAQAGLSLGGEE